MAQAKAKRLMQIFLVAAGSALFSGACVNRYSERDLSSVPNTVVNPTKMPHTQEPWEKDPTYKAELANLKEVQTTRLEAAATAQDGRRAACESQYYGSEREAADKKKEEACKKGAEASFLQEKARIVGQQSDAERRLREIYARHHAKIQQENLRAVEAEAQVEAKRDKLRAGNFTRRTQETCQDLYNKSVQSGRPLNDFQQEACAGFIPSHLPQPNP